MQALTLIEVLRHRSSMDRVGVTFIEGGSKEKFLSYREVYERASRTLKTLQQRGLQAGNELVFQIEDNETFVNVFWACILGGIIPVPLSIGHKVDHKKKLFNVWQVLNDPFLIANGDHLSKLDEFVQKAQLDGVLDTMSERFIALESLSPADQPGKIHSADPDDIAFIQFSSGSTGQPKGVVLTHRNLITNIRAIAAAAKYAPDDATLGWMPLTHDMGMIGFHINPLFSGMSQFLMPTSLFVRRPALWLDKTSAHKVTVTCSPNFGYKYLMKHVPDSDAQDWDLSSVRVLYNGAEPISEDLCHKFLDRMAIHGLKKTAMCPVYGLAEATLAVSVSVLDAEVRSCRVLREELKVGEEIVLSNDPEESVAFVNVGTAVDDCSIRIIDERGLRVPEGIVGYLKIKGPNVTAGYYNNDAESQRVIDEDQWLNTGDLAFIKDGDLFITGRAKDIIFVNGQNYYPHDIEDIACELDGIDLNKIALGGYFNEKLQREETFAFIFHRAKLEAFIPLAKAVKALVNSKVGFELDRVLPVKSLPKTTSGKLQRYRLLQDYRKGKFQKVEEELNELEAKLRKRAMSIVAPKNKREKKMLKIWQKVLNFKDFGVTDKFFEIGGNSLKAAEIGMSVLREFQVEIPLEWLHSKECIREMVAALKSLEKQVYKPLPKNIQATNVNIAPAQKRLYYSWEMNRNAVAYNTPIALRIGGVKLAADRLEQCIAQLLERHESLRTSFHLNDDQVQFSIAEKVDFQLTQMNCPKEELDKRLRALVQPFDLQKAPLFRVALLQINHYEQVLFADFHHIISDGVSIHTFLNELVNLYIGKTLPPLSANYRDYAAWMNGQLTEEAMLEKENYWLELLSGELPVLDLPLDFQRPAVFDTKGAKLSKSLGRKLSNQLRELARQSDSSLHSLLFTAYQILLAKYTGQNEQLIGIPVAGRIHPDLQDIQGMFVNNLTLRNTTDGNESFMALLKKVKDHLAAAMQQQAYPFDQLVQQLVKRRDASRNPIFDTMFVYQNMGLPAVENYGMILTRHDFDPGFSKFDLSLEIFEEENIAYAFEYATALFKEETIEKLAGHFLNLLQEIVRHPNKEIKTLSLLDKDEYSSYVEAYNATEAIYPKNKSIHQVFEEQVARTPGSIAVEWGDVQLTYQQLNQKANALAIELRDRGLKPNEVVCILLSRSTDFLISVLGILKAGACFLPIDTNLPAKRIRFILEDSACKILLTKSEQPLAPPAQVYRIDMDQWMPNASPVNYLKSVTKADDLAYVIYTSGTTGRPKGVMISHRSLVNYIDYCCKTYVKGESADFPLFTSVSFDLTITSIFTPLASGHRILIYEDDPKAVLIEKIVADDRVDIIKLTPSHLRIIRECFLKNSHLNSRIKRFIIGGEALETALARQIYIGFNGKVELFNEYGPTEATVGCMIHKYQLEDTTASVPIGFPIQNTAIYLLDQYLCPVPLGVKGEVYISGSGVARGYLFNDQLTTERFIDDPFVANRKMYKTGDVARRLPNSGLEFIERVDLQVKINGYRIELTEIEQQMLSHEQVSEALVSIEDHANGQKLLYAYYMCEPSTDLTIDQATLRHYLASRLPHYMMPVHFIKLDEIPLTINGKVNYSALPKPKADKARPEGTLPGGMVEAVSLEAWEEVFGQKVNVTDNFFELGGDSIKAVQIASRLSEKGVGIVVKDILTYQTIGQISKHAKISFKDQHYEQGVVEGARKATPIEQWFFSRQLQNPHYFNQSVLLKLQRKVDRRLLERSFDLLIAHHDGLRLNYDWHGQNLYYNNNHLNERFDIQELSFDELPQFKATFRLEEGLLLKAALLRQIKEEETYLFITAHHLLVDGISWRIFLEDLHSCYNALESGHSPQLPRKAASLMDWKKALDEYQNAADWQQEKSFWEEVKTANCELPQDMETTDWRVAQAANISASLDADATAYLLKEAHKAYKTDVPILLNTALLMALHKWTDQRQFIIEQENHGRHLDHLDTSRTLGWFTCMFPLKLHLLDGPLDEQIKSVKEQIRQVPAKGIGYGLSCEAEDWQREKQSQIRFNYLGQFDHELENDLFSYSTLATSSDVAPENAMTTKLECNLMVVRNCLKIDIQYNRNAHHRTTIERLKESFIKSIHRLLDHIREEEQIHFTPSDFDAADVKQEELDALFD